MGKVEEAQEILKALGLPPAQRNEMSALTLLALCQLGPDDAWIAARRASLTVTKGIMAFVERHYGRAYAPNTRETFRRQVLHQLVQAAIVDYNPDDPTLATNSPRAHYALTDAALAVAHAYGGGQWPAALDEFRNQHGALLELYLRRRAGRLVPLRLPGDRVLGLSPGRHNELQAAIVEQFVPRFVPGARLLYLGDTANKTAFIDEQALSALGLRLTEHDKLPDVLLYDDQRQWLVLVEAVTSHGPMSPKRVVELEHMFSPSPAGRIFMSAFPTFTEFRKHLNSIAWETEVWIAEIPDHLIHYNGDKFLSPR